LILVEKRLEQPFLEDGANAVDVPGKNLHVFSLVTGGPIAIMPAPTMS
jgi:hypothetical protein